MNPKVEFYFNKATQWQEEISKLRTIVLECGLTEELKWGCPCYTYPAGGNIKRKQANIVLIHVFKEYCALLFFKGALLQDAHGILVQQTQHVQAARQVRFTNVNEIARMTTVLKALIHEAIEVEKAGLTVTLKKTNEFNIPEEFEAELRNRPGLQKAFYSLTPGRQRAYLLYFAAPKQSKTRLSRIEKCIPRILNGRGLND